jgi:uncharacterized RDD family membrane protein YckC
VAQEPEEGDSGLRGVMRRTVGRVTHTIGDAASGVTEATAERVIEDLQPYLISEAVPRIVDGITPYLVETVVPEILAGVHEHLVTGTVPAVVDGVSAHLIDVTVPQVLSGATPALVQDLIPQILDDLRPYLETDLVPAMVDALVPRLTAVVVPRIIEDIMPTLEQEVAPQLIDALIPKIEQEVAPQLVDALMPKIRREVVPVILQDIVDDPSVRDLIREQSQGLVLDALEALRENIADVDNLVERIVRGLVRKAPRPEPESGLDLVLQSSRDDLRPQVTLANLAERRREWQQMELPPAPPGREYAFAGVITRLASFAIDVTLMGWIVSQGFAAAVSLLESLFGTLPGWVVPTIGIIAASLVPLYLAASWSIVGRSLGSFIVGTRVCTADGLRPGFIRALVRAWLEVLGITVFLITFLPSFFDDRRRTVMDDIARTEVRFVVPHEQQNRYIRDALAKREKERASAD